ncbi:uncharacterized protein B4U80_13352, partial [Leptotrombidium deliense]
VLSEHCPPGWVRLFGNKCVQIRAVAMSLPESRQDCKQHNATLFIPKSMIENDCAKSLIPLMPTGGNYYRLDGYIGTDSSWYTTNGRLLDNDFMNLKADISKNRPNPGNCLVMQKDGFWNYLSCDKNVQIFHVCEKYFKTDEKSPILRQKLINVTNMQNREDEIAMEDIRNTIKDLKEIENFKINYKAKKNFKKQRTFQVVQKKMSFEEANSFCGTFGGKLIEVESADMNNFIIKNAKEHSSYWINAIKPIPEATDFVNLKGQKLTYEMAKAIVDESYADPSCIKIKDGQWHITGCRNEANVICELSDKAENPDFNDFKSLIEYLARAPAKASYLRHKAGIIQTLLLQQLENKQEVMNENTDTSVSTCPTGWLRFFGSKCVSIAIQPMAQQDAIIDCKQKSGKLFLPQTNAENECAKSLFSLIPYGGAYFRLDGRGKSQREWYTEDGVLLDPYKTYNPYTNFRSDYKAVISNPTMCVVMQNDGQWLWQYCAYVGNTFHVCEFEKNRKTADNVTQEVLRILLNMKNDKSEQIMSDEGMLPEDDKVKMLKNTDHYQLKYQTRTGLRRKKIYYVIENPGTFEGANAACKLLGAKLAEIESASESDFLRRNLNRGYHWISAIKPIPEATEFVTSEGKKLPYEPESFDASEDTGDFKTCIALNSGLWVEMNCMERANVICEFEPAVGIPGFQEYDSLIERVGNVPKQVTFVERRMELVQQLMLQEMKEQKEIFDELNTNICHLK